MKSPITGKEMSFLQREEIITFRKEKYNYIHFNYFCKDSGEYFSTTELDELNLNQVYNKYRDRHNIPFPDEIKNLKKRLDLTSVKMSQILGFGTNSYRNYEKGEVPSLANANLINLVLNDTKSFRNLVQLNNDLKDNEKQKILLKIDSLIEEEEEFNNDFEYVKNLFGGNLLPDNFSGYVKPSMKKLSEMVVYFTEQLTPTKTMMNKLLFYSDFLHYKNSGFSISGTRYVAHNYGPVPDRFYGIFDYLIHKNVVSFLIEDYGNGYIGERFCQTSKSLNLDIFSREEVASMKSVYNKFKNFNATQIMKTSHEELAWIDNEKERSLIDYSYGFNLKHV